jgi:hypothetical protein
VLTVRLKDQRNNLLLCLPPAKNPDREPREVHLFAPDDSTNCPTGRRRDGCARSRTDAGRGRQWLLFKRFSAPVLHRFLYL